MANYNKFEVFVGDLCSGYHNFLAAGHVFKVYLSNATPSASADSIKTDLAEISAGNGYTAGGDDVQNDMAEAGGVATVTGVKVVITCTTNTIGPFQYVPLYNDSQTSPVDPLVAWWDYGTALTLNPAETFSIKFNGSDTTGTIFTLS